MAEVAVHAPDPVPQYHKRAVPPAPLERRPNGRNLTALLHCTGGHRTTTPSRTSRIMFRRLPPLPPPPPPRTSRSSRRRCAKARARARRRGGLRSSWARATRTQPTAATRTRSRCSTWYAAHLTRVSNARLTLCSARAAQLQLQGVQVGHRQQQLPRADEGRPEDGARGARGGGAHGPHGVGMGDVGRRARHLGHGNEL